MDILLYKYGHNSLLRADTFEQYMHQNLDTEEYIEDDEAVRSSIKLVGTKMLTDADADPWRNEIRNVEVDVCIVIQPRQPVALFADLLKIGTQWSKCK